MHFLSPGSGSTEYHLHCDPDVTRGRPQASSIFGSHLTVVVLFYGSAIFAYMRPNSKIMNERDKVISVFYSAVTPMLNPIIYSLRNKDVKGGSQEGDCKIVFLKVESLILMTILGMWRKVTFIINFFPFSFHSYYSVFFSYFLMSSQISSAYCLIKARNLDIYRKVT